MIKRLVVALAALLLPAYAAAVPILSAPFVTAAPGDTITIPISITDAVDLQFFQFDLSFNAAVAQADIGGFTAGPDLPPDWFFLSPGAVDNTTGNILGVAAAGSAFSGSGVIAVIDFTALDVGASPLDLSNVFLNLSDQEFIVIDGLITVAVTPAPPAVPEPATLGLLVCALVLLRVCRRRNQPKEVQS
jgi:hypothetical protein